MQRFGRVLRLQKGKELEYEKYHAAVWPEVLNACHQAGIRNYTIFRYGSWLFAYFELPDEIALEAAGRATEACAACRRWETRMHSLQEPLPESGPENWWVTMKPVFHCE